MSLFTLSLLIKHRSNFAFKTMLNQKFFELKMSTSASYYGRFKRRENVEYKNPYADILIDDMEYKTPQEIKDEIDFMHNFNLNEIMKRQDKAFMDVEAQRKRGEFANIERKYFRRKPEICFLTWDMKEHIKNLHSINPVLWTFEKLSYAFPASIHEIKKIIKDREKPPTIDKIKAHDLRVLQNWKEYRKGRFGSLALLKKKIEGRIYEVDRNTTHLSVPSGTEKNVQDFLSNLKFTGVDDKPAFIDEESRKHLNKLKKSYPFKYTFKHILDKYKEDLKQIKQLESSTESNIDSSMESNMDSNKDSNTMESDKQIVPCKDLSQIIPIYRRKDDENYVQISSPNSEENEYLESQFITNKKHMTYDHFIRLKKKIKKRK